MRELSDSGSREARSQDAACLDIVVLGGGNGISTVLRGLARRLRAGSAMRITAVVATADDGGSSGRIRQQLGGLPPGDLRRCLLALARSDDDPLVRLFGHRWAGEGDLQGHALGNLVLSALAEQHGSYLEGLEVAGRWLGTCGRVLPVTLDEVRLRGVTRDGRRLDGESTIGEATTMQRVALSPSDAAACPGVLPAIRRANLVVVGPGSLFTSLLPVLLVPGVADAVRGCRGERVLVANLMTQPGETLDMTLLDHLLALDRHAGRGLVRHVLASDELLPASRLEPYASQRSRPVAPEIPGRPEQLLRVPLMTAAGKIRHDPDRLAAALVAIAESAREAAASSPGAGATGRAPESVSFGMSESVDKEGH